MKRAKSEYTVCVVDHEHTTPDNDCVVIFHLRSYSLIHLADDLFCAPEEIYGVWDGNVPDKDVLTWFHLMSGNKAYCVPGRPWFNKNV